MDPIFSPWLPWFLTGIVITLADLPDNSCFSIQPIMVYGRHWSYVAAMPGNRAANRRHHIPKERKADLTGAKP